MRQEIGEPQQAGVGELFGQLARDAKELAQAELALAKLLTGAMVNRYRRAAVFLGTAAILALAGLIALLVGLIMTFATLLGPGWATALVCGAVFFMAAVLALVGRRRLGAAA